MCSAFHFNNGFIDADAVVAMLQIKAKSEIGGVFEEDIAYRAVHDVVDRRSL